MSGAKTVSDLPSGLEVATALKRGCKLDRLAIERSQVSV
jgi:hypothetical protein